MKLLVVGGGGREHALAWKICQSPECETCYVAPGNAGTARLEKAENVKVGAEDVPGIVKLAREKRVGLVIVGPEAPLAAGMGDALRQAGIKVFGPNKDAAKLESSKVWAKRFMQKHGIPTAAYKVFEHAGKARAYLEQGPCPIVIKADGLAAGKGVTVARTREAGYAAVKTIMEDRAYGSAGTTVVIEDCLAGEEVSVLAITDGRTIMTLPSAQDHKPVYNDDKGPNTGGMGAYSPAPVLTNKLSNHVDGNVLVPTVHALGAEGFDYKGVVYAGLMLTKGGPRVLEFNIRFGDPETQPILMRLKSDLVPILRAAVEGTLEDLPDEAFEWDPRPCVAVVMASGGYPGKYQKGHVIEGLDAVAAEKDVMVFHAGTALNEDGQVVTAGGRVLAVAAMGRDIAEAQQRAYENVAKIKFQDAHYRTDIASRALAKRKK